MKRNRVNGLAIVATCVLTASAAFGQLAGDLDANGQVDLFDLTEFVGCLDGPGGGAIAPACDLANFDPATSPDTDIDLRDFAGFQSRFGFGQGPPQIVSFTPAPGKWVVDDIGLTKVTIGFSEPVIVPADAVDVWTLTGGTVTGFATSYDPDTFVLTVSFASALRDDQVTVVVDFTIEDVAGNPLDGEIQTPLNAALPSGNDINGGQGVFRIRVLQGDANRDGVVDAADLILINESYDFCEGDTYFDPNADLNGDGCVGAMDEAIVGIALGTELPVADGTPPSVVTVSASGSGSEVDTVRITFDERIPGLRITRQTCFLVDSVGNVLVSTFASQSILGDAADYFFVPPINECGSYTINVSNALTDFSGELLIPPGAQSCP